MAATVTSGFGGMWPGYSELFFSGTSAYARRRNAAQKIRNAPTGIMIRKIVAM